MTRRSHRKKTHVSHIISTIMIIGNTDENVFTLFSVQHDINIKTEVLYPCFVQSNIYMYLNDTQWRLKIIWDALNVLPRCI